MSNARPAHLFVPLSRICGCVGKHRFVKRRGQRYLFLAFELRMSELLRLVVSLFLRTPRGAANGAVTDESPVKMAGSSSCCMPADWMRWVDARIWVRMTGSRLCCLARLTPIVRNCETLSGRRYAVTARFMHRHTFLNNVIKDIFPSNLHLCWSSPIDLLCGKLKWVVYQVLMSLVYMQVKAV